MRLLAVLLISTRAFAQCPSQCNQRGLCSREGECECFDGFEGADCSRRSCPKGRAWSDVAGETDEAHARVTCSNRGHCDYRKGLCDCDANFDGNACERLKCPNDCSGKGECLSLKEAGRAFDGYFLNRSVHRYEDDGVPYNLWDADKIYGCLQCCDIKSFVDFYFLTWSASCVLEVVIIRRRDTKKVFFLFSGFPML